jgi:F0F1-type ATP synthase membrane subunit c/vacuolar-type H+-ATPase subunit K
MEVYVIRIPPNFNKTMQQPPKIHIIAAALHVSILIYGFVVFLLARSSGGWTMGWNLRPGNEILFYALAGASAMTGLLSVVLPRLLRSAAPAPSTPHEVGQAPLFFDFSQVTPQLLSLTITRMALAETIAIFGFVLAFLNQAASWILPFAAAGLLLQILVGPFGRYLRGA